MGRKILRMYLIANEGAKEEVYFSVRRRWAEWVKERHKNISAESMYSLAARDSSSMMTILPKKCRQSLCSLNR